jgi:hypothetical protein
MRERSRSSMRLLIRLVSPEITAVSASWEDRMCPPSSRLVTRQTPNLNRVPTTDHGHCRGFSSGLPLSPPTVGR